MMSTSPSNHHYYNSVHANATDRSPVCMLPSPNDPDLAPELARMQASRQADLLKQSNQSKPTFVLGTRTSKLAMVQTELVKAQLEKIWPGRQIRISGMVSLNNT